MMTYRFLAALALCCALGVASSGCAAGGDPETTAFVQERLTTHFGPSVEASDVECPPIGREAAQEVTCTSTVNGIPLEWTVTTTPEADGQPFGFDAYPTATSFSDMVEMLAFTLSSRNLGLNLDSAECPASLDAATVGMTADCALVADGVPFRGRMQLGAPDGVAPYPSVSLYADGAMIRPLIEQNVGQSLSQSVGAEVQVSCEMPTISATVAGSQFFCELLAPAANRTGAARVTVRDLSGEITFAQVWDAAGGTP